MPQEYTQKYTIVCFFDVENSPARFSALDWPLHVTMLDTFKTKWPLEILIQKLKNLTLTTRQFDVLPTKAALLGPKKDVPVKLLRLDAGLAGLHNKLLELADNGSFVFNSPEFVGEGFLPHATDQNSGQVEIGQPYLLTSISLVDMFPHGDHMQRNIAATFSLGS